MGCNLYRTSVTTLYHYLRQLITSWRITRDKLCMDFCASLLLVLYRSQYKKNESFVAVFIRVVDQSKHKCSIAYNLSVCWKVIQLPTQICRMKKERISCKLLWHTIEPLDQVGWMQKNTHRASSLSTSGNCMMRWTERKKCTYRASFFDSFFRIKKKGSFRSFLSSNNDCVYEFMHESYATILRHYLWKHSTRWK